MKRTGFLIIILLFLLVSCKPVAYCDISTRSLPAEGGSILMTPSTRPAPEGTLLTFKATPSNGYVFSGWEGSFTGTENPITIIATSSISVTALFTLQEDPGIQYTETTYVSPREFRERLGHCLHHGVHLSGLSSDGAYSFIPSWVNATSVYTIFEKMVQLGVKTVRMSVNFTGELGPAPEFEINADWLKKIDMYVNACEHYNLNVVFLVSHEQGTDQSRFPNPLFAIDFDGASKAPEIYEYESARNKALWLQLAHHYREKGDFLMFEPFNEPRMYDFRGDIPKQIDVLNRLTQEFVNVVRSTGGNNASRWLAAVSWVCDGNEALASLTIPEDYVSNNRIFVPFHFYSGLFDDDTITEWGHTATLTNPYIWKYDEEYVKTLFGNLKKKYVDKGIPVTLEETGCRNGANDRQFAFEKYYLEYVFRCATLCDMPAFLHTIDGGGDTNYGYYDFSKKKFRLNGQEIHDLIINAISNDSPDYTLESVYDRAPFQVESIIEIDNAVLRRFLLNEYDLNNDGKLSFAEVMKAIKLDLSSLQLEECNEVGKLLALVDLTCHGSYEKRGLLESLDISNNKELVCLDVDFNSLKQLKLNENIVNLTCRSNQLYELDFSSSTKIETLRCFDNPMKDIDITELSKLGWLDCCELKITKLDTSRNPKLRELRCHTNQLKSLDISHNKELEYLDCYSTAIHTLDVSHNPKLQVLHAWNCPNLSVIYLKSGQVVPDLVKDDHTQIEYVQ